MRVVPTSGLVLAVATIGKESWCHPECYDRWRALDRPRQGIIGGHIHYEAEGDSWSVPFDVPLKTIGELSPGGVARVSR